MTRLSRNAFASTWILGSALSLFSSVASAQECRKDMDCPGDTVCEAGRCVGENGAASTYAAPLTPAAPLPAPAPAPNAVATPSPAPAAPAPAPVAGAVAIQFVSRNATEELTVRDMHTNVTCTTPCTLQLPPGRRSIQVGTARAEDFDVPAQPSTFTVAEPTRSRRNGGIVLTAVGGGVFGLGALFLVAANSQDEDPYETESSGDDSEPARTIGIVGLVLGGASLLTGVIMLASSDMKPIRPLEAQKRRAAAAPTLHAVADVDQNGGFLGVRGSF